MSVRIVDSEDVAALICNPQHIAPQVKNFFNVFGTAGCLLNCEMERIFEQGFQYNRENHVVHSKAERRVVRSGRREHRQQYLMSRQEWFTTTTVTKSAAQGCGSCSVLRQMLYALFPEDFQDLSVEYEYSISQWFELKRRPPSAGGSMDIIQLFQPPSRSLLYI
jgi:hypothetical protein